MSLKTWFSQSTRPIRNLRNRFQSLSQLIFFVRILSWWGLLRALQPFFSVQQLVSLATCGERTGRTQPSEVLPGLVLLYDVFCWTDWGDCLPRALVSRRFLKMAGIDSTIIIGFNGGNGHSWVEVAHEPFLETVAKDMSYLPTLILGSRDRKLIQTTSSDLISHPDQQSLNMP